MPSEENSVVKQPKNFFFPVCLSLLDLTKSKNKNVSDFTLLPWREEPFLRFREASYWLKASGAFSELKILWRVCSPVLCCEFCLHYSPQLHVCCLAKYLSSMPLSRLHHWYFNSLKWLAFSRIVSYFLFSSHTPGRWESHVLCCLHWLLCDQTCSWCPDCRPDARLLSFHVLDIITLSKFHGWRSCLDLTFQSLSRAAHLSKCWGLDSGGLPKLQAWLSFRVLYLS